MKKKITEILRASYTDEEYRKIVIFDLMNILLALISFVMTLVNLFTNELQLMFVTLLFSLLCLCNYVMVSMKKFPKEVAFLVFSAEAIVLLCYFIYSGIPDGFSVLWTLLVPSLSMAIFGRRMGVHFSAAVFLMVIFFFWMPIGRALLMYQYHETFMLRFPFVYICIFLASLYLETIRSGVYLRLRETEQRTRYLYRHDALTTLYSRHAFRETLEEKFSSPSDHPVSVVVLDLDDFKAVNDVYGHTAGDKVLKNVAQILLDHICEHCVACRWGGEEFLIFMRCEHDHYVIAEEIRKLVEASVIVYENQKIHVTVSVGIATAKALQEEALGDLINCADKAMYASKETGKNKTTRVFMEK